MNNKLKPILGGAIALIATVLFEPGCNNHKEPSPFDKILSKAPFSELTDSIRMKPGNDELYFRRAVLLNRNGYPEPALADFQKAWSLKNVEDYALGIGTLLLEKRPDSAILFLTQAMETIPKSILLKLTLARALEARGRFDEAMNQVDSILLIEPRQVDVLKMKASLFEKKGDSLNSMKILEKAYTITPYDPELNYVLALRYAEKKDPKVLALCDSLILVDSLKDHAEPYYYKGIYFSNTHNITAAKAQFELAIQHNYNFLEAYIEMGSLSYDQNKFPDALKTFQLANRINPAFADAYYWIGKCQQAMGQKDEARLNYLRAYNLDKTIIEAKEAADKLK